MALDQSNRYVDLKLDEDDLIAGSKHVVHAEGDGRWHDGYG